ncbi:hypothetical protein SAMN05216486_1278, partial [bacterium JGI 053]
LPSVDRRVLDLADKAVRTFARCRDACTRPLVREGADILRHGLAEHRRHQERRNVEKEAHRTAYHVTTLRERREWVGKCFKLLQTRAEVVYSDPAAAVKRALAYVREHGAPEFSKMLERRPSAFGTLRRARRADWLGFLGFTDTFWARTNVIYFRASVVECVRESQNFPTQEEVARALEEAKAAAAAFAALAPPKAGEEAPDRLRPARLAASRFFDAMRLMQRRPRDAAPDVKRQLAAMLPTDDDTAFLITYAVQLAVQQDQASHRRGGGAADSVHAIFR